MSVYITSGESRLAAKWMSDLERNRRNWIWKRWLMLVLAVAILLGVIAMTLMMDNKMPPTRFDANFEDETTTPLMIKSYVDERNVYFYNQAFTTIQIFIWSSLGVLLALGCILQWDRHTRDALILKILRQELQNEIQIMPDDTERPLDILLVEDNPGDAFLTKEALSEGKLRFNFHVVPDGSTAIDYLYRRGTYANAQGPDVILLDIHMPKKDGREVLEEIKADAKLKDIPVVLLTASKEEQPLLEKYGMPPDQYLVKPVELARFIGLIKNMEQLSWAARQLDGEEGESETTE